MCYIYIWEESMPEEINISAVMRTEFGTGAARATRRKSMVPAVIYGPKQPLLAICIEEKEITKRYRAPSFTSTVIHLHVDDKQYKVLPKEVQLHPVTDIITHVDFTYLSEKSQKVSVPIVYQGRDKAIGVKRGGFFNIILRKLDLLCQVENIPSKLVIDVTNMHIGQSIKIHDLELPTGCELLSKSNKIIASIIGSKGSKTDSEETTATAS